jgi:hypothetical protein
VSGKPDYYASHQTRTSRTTAGRATFHTAAPTSTGCLQSHSNFLLSFPRSHYACQGVVHPHHSHHFCGSPFLSWYSDAASAHVKVAGAASNNLAWAVMNSKLCLCTFCLKHTFRSSRDRQRRP